MKLKISFGTPAQRLARWERIQKAGMLRFVVARGLLFGVTFGVVVWVISPPPQPWYAFMAEVFVMSVVWAIAMWFVTMWQYRRAQEQSQM
jgi:membrane protein YdbS with pleckstrin-like domain